MVIDVVRKKMIAKLVVRVILFLGKLKTIKVLIHLIVQK
jgi:hypothetical protein